MMRLSVSRPSVSVPSQCSGGGAWSTCPRAGADGSYGAISGAKNALSTSPSTVTAPNTTTGRPKKMRAKRRSAGTRRRDSAALASRALVGGAAAVVAISAVLDARIEPAIDDVDHQVGQDDGHGHDQDDPLDDRVVLGQHAIEQHGRHAGNDENRL